MAWLRKLLGVRPKPTPVPPPQTGDAKVEEDHLREENIQKREKAMEDGGGRNLEEV
jgi:hypothetical protein